MNIAQTKEFILTHPDFRECISSQTVLDALPAMHADFPADMPQRLVEALQAGGIRQLYTHQYTAWETAQKGRDLVVVTPTASGKSLTYLLPIFKRKLENPHSRALLLFPTKALSQDQQASINLFNDRLKADAKIYTYDGDTPGTVRRKIMAAGDFVVTNPDMLHAGILPHHTNWIKLFENLDYVVIDELHTYRGVFGSHVANVIRRLLRICEFYGSRPQFLCCSATIGNPAEHASALTSRDCRLIDENGAPRGSRHILFYNPPVVNKALGVRVSAIKEAARLGALLIQNQISVIFFCRSRVRVELLFSYLRERCPLQKDRIRAYRGGYLPGERRKIEAELREGQILAVVSTNALELGVDIGMLDASVTVGYPGSISSLLQQFGRAGRRQSDALSILMATSDATDQYLAHHPEYFLHRNPEQAVLNTDNLLIVGDHIKCAAFELPFRADEQFGSFTATGEMLQYLTENGVLYHAEDRYHWMSDVYPANQLHLRQGSRENVVIIDITEKGREQTIGELDIFAVPTELHTDAIYIHQGQQYYVEELLWEDLQARVRRINVDYFTDAQDKVEVSILSDEERGHRGGFGLYQGELMLRTRAVMFKKLKLHTHENLGWGDIHLPELEMHSEGAWILLPTEHPLNQRFSAAEVGGMLAGAAQLLGRVAPLVILCDPRDIRARSEVKSASFHAPVIYFYDAVPGGIGLSYKLLQNLPVIAGVALSRLQECSCEAGCPACVGVPDADMNIKTAAAAYLAALSENHG
ncbi:MAG: DEAD/DEAH box helicase [Leptospiraceae bacterium]|nr:DEAD/DEAH box helicase [Leptospiraceae bacterium]